MMIARYALRCLNHKIEHVDDNVDIEVSPIPGPTKRVFVILDLSDSCSSILRALKKLTWVWRRFPPQWQVSLFALGDPAPLYPSAETMYVRDLESFFRELEGTRQWDDWRANHLNRGSFLQPTLDGIEEMCRSEYALDESTPSESVLLLITDGELLDPDPIRVPAGMKCIGIRCNDSVNRYVDWERVLSPCPLFELESTELNALFGKLMAPGMELCDVVTNFPCEIKGNQASRVRAGKSINWNFANGPLVLSIPNSLLGKTDAFIECHSRQRDVTRLTLDTLANNLKSPHAVDLPNASLGNEFFAIVDDDSVVKKLLSAFRTQSAKGLPLNENAVSLLQESLSASTRFDNAIIVVLPIPSAVKPDQDEMEIHEGMGELLLVGKLHKDPSHLFYMEYSESVPSDPGVTPREELLVQYNGDAARWYLFLGGNRRTLAPRGGGPLLGIFVDVYGNECEAYYSGPLLSRKAE